MFKAIPPAAAEMLLTIELSGENGIPEIVLLERYGSDDGNYRLKILLDSDFVHRTAYRPNSYGLTPRGRDYLAWERKRIDDERKSAEERKRERKYANRKSNIAMVISGAALLVSILSNLERIAFSVYAVAQWVSALFHR